MSCLRKGLYLNKEFEDELKASWKLRMLYRWEMLKLSIINGFMLKIEKLKK